MKKNHHPEPLLVAKAAGRFPEGSDPGVDPFGRCQERTNENIGFRLVSPPSSGDEPARATDDQGNDLILPAKHGGLGIS